MVATPKPLIRAGRALLAFSIAAAASAQEIRIDNTCGNCSRRMNDSINALHRRAIRVDQAGYVPDQPRKIAYLAGYGDGSFGVIDSAGKSVFSGALGRLGTFPHPALIATGYRDAVTQDYRFASADTGKEELCLADFSALRTPGRYRVVRGADTSAAFLIHPEVYAKVLEKVLFFFGASRCGPGDGWLHAACHLKDGSALGAAYAGRLAGGWHDCGDHGKYAQTTAYAALVLSLAYAIWPERAPDRYGKSYADAAPDGIPDLLAEAKVGADYIQALYAVSKEKGLLGSSDMFHSVGSGPGMDHSFWDLPERQDAAPLSRGGPDRPVARGIGSNVAGAYAAALALTASAWKGRDPAYAAELQQAALDIYDSIVAKRPGTLTSMPCCYTGGGKTRDDEAMADLALWYLTGQARFGTALLAKISPTDFAPGGWPTDFENSHAFVLFGFAKLILRDAPTAARFGVEPARRDSLLGFLRDRLKRYVQEGSAGANGSPFPGTDIRADIPYHGLFTSVDWGFDRYNMGVALEALMYFDLTGESAYEEAGLDNMHYLLGANPYDVSFVMGCGDRNLQHPHYRAANPDGYNQGGTAYPYRTPIGAVMGGTRPDRILLDEWDIYDNTESCIDFAAQAIFPLLILGGGPDGTTGLEKRTGKAFRPGIRNGRGDFRDVLGRKPTRGRSGRGATEPR